MMTFPAAQAWADERAMLLGEQRDLRHRLSEVNRDPTMLVLEKARERMALRHRLEEIEQELIELEDVR